MPVRRRERRAPPPGRKSGSAIERRRCPRCGRNTLEFAQRVAVIVRPADAEPTNDDDEDRKLRLRYEPAWLCGNDECRYVRLVRR
jgi:hypothetical protein